MRHLRAVRLLTAAALVVPASLTGWVLAGPASATAAPVTCSTLSGAGLTSTLSNCTDAANTGGKGSAVSKVGKGTSGTTTIKWNKTGTTTLSFTYTVVKANKCAKGLTEIVETGKVTGGTGAAIKSILKGQKTSATVCEGKTVALLKGTKFVL
jgi:hypothetical protein